MTKRNPATRAPAGRTAAAAEIPDRVQPRQAVRAGGKAAAADKGNAKATAKGAMPRHAPKHRAHGKASKKLTGPRPNLVRDSFTMPQSDFAVIATLKATALGARRAAKKSELLRAGLRALAALDAKALVAALDRLDPVKTGRPKKGH